MIRVDLLATNYLAVFANVVAAAAPSSRKSKAFVEKICFNIKGLRFTDVSAAERKKISHRRNHRKLHHEDYGRLVCASCHCGRGICPS
jgi:hypothetical protein